MEEQGVANVLKEELKLQISGHTPCSYIFITNTAFDMLSHIK